MSALYAIKVTDVKGKEKKPRSEKQIAAFAKAQEARKRKREERAELDKEIEDKKDEIKKVNEEIEITSKKRKTKKPETPPPSEVTEEEEDEEEETEIKQEEVVSNDDGTPPKWFIEHLEKKKAEKSDTKESIAWLSKYLKKAQAEEARKLKEKEKVIAEPINTPAVSKASEVVDYQPSLRPGKPVAQQIRPEYNERTFSKTVAVPYPPIYGQIFPGRSG